MPKLDLPKLRLLAQSPDDLPLIASAVQDGILQIGGVIYDPKGRYVTMRLTRFMHEAAKPARIESGLRFDGVMSFQSKGVEQGNPEAMTVILDVKFEDIDAPAGHVTLTLAGGGAFRFAVEALDVILADVGQPRATKAVPEHESAS